MTVKRFKEIFNTGGWLVHVRRAFDSTCYFEGYVYDIPLAYDDREVLLVMPFHKDLGDVSFDNDWQMLDVGIGD